MVLDELDELVARRVVVDAPLHHLLPDVEVNLAGRASDVAEIRVGHLARTVHDAAHDRDGHAGEVPGALGDGGGHLLQVEERAAAGRARDVLRLGVAHARALEEAEGGAAEVVELRGGVLDEDAVAEAVAEQAANLGARLDDDVVLDVGVGELDVVNHRHGRSRGEDVREQAARRVEAGDTRRALDEGHDGIHAERSLDLLLGLGAVEDDGDARGAVGHSRGCRVLGGDEGDGVVHRTLRQLRRVGHHADANLLEAADRSHRLLVAGRGDLGEEDGVGGGDVAEGHAHRELGSEIAVKGILRRELRGGDGGEDRAVAVEDVPEVDGVVLLLDREIGRATREVLEVASLLLELLDAPLLLGGFVADVPEAGARLHLEVRSLGEGDADGVAEAVEEQGADADGGLHASVLALASLGHAQVKRVVPAELVHLVREESVRLHHHQRVGRLHGEDKVVVVVLAADAGKLERGLDHARGGIAVAGEGPGGEGPVVGADAHGDAALLALEHERREDLLDLLNLGVVLLVRLVQDVLELLPPVREVTGVDADLVEALGDHHGHLGREVDVGDEGRVVPVLDEALLDLGARLGLLHTLDGDADHLGAGVGALLHLRIARARGR